MFESAWLTFQAFLGRLGRPALQMFEYIVDINTFIAITFRNWLARFTLKRSPLPSMLIPQMIHAGIDALFIMGFLGLIVGFGIVFRFMVILNPITDMETVSRLIIDIIALELNPLICAIALASRSGTAITFEMGQMVIRKELESLEHLGVNPLDYFVFPSLLAMTLSQMILSLFFTCVALISGILISGFLISVSRFELLAEMMASISLMQIFIFMLKNALFGLTIAAVATFNGLRVSISTTEVSKQTQRTMTLCLIMIFLIDAFFAVALL